jgi:hypothetical protein
LTSPLKHIEAPLDQIPDDVMKDFIKRTIQREHGDLEGQTSNVGASSSEWPPPSTLGRALIESDRGKSLIHDTETRAEGNLAWARLRLDDICKAETIEDTMLRKDRLPRNLVSLFDAGVREVESQQREVASLGLKAILLASLGSQAFPSIRKYIPEELLNEEAFDKNEEMQGVPFVAIRNWIYDHKVNPYPDLVTIKEVLHAAMGFLKVDPDDDDRISVYHKDFGLYVCERYNTKLVQEFEALQSMP